MPLYWRPQELKTPHLPNLFRPNLVHYPSSQAPNTKHASSLIRPTFHLPPSHLPLSFSRNPTSSWKEKEASQDSISSSRWRQKGEKKEEGARPGTSPGWESVFVVFQPVANIPSILPSFLPSPRPGPVLKPHLPTYLPIYLTYLPHLT
jgi:hypothetical protein